METFETNMLSQSQARIILTDVACSSVMRLDNNSMDKLLDLMVMVYKWQMYLLRKPEDLIKLTLKHLDCIGKILPELQKLVLIDEAKQKIIDNWECLDEDSKYVVVRNLNRWLSPFHTKISLLMRVKLQNSDGTFVDRHEAENNSFYNYYIKNNGENIYEVISNFPTNTSLEVSASSSKHSFEIDQLFNQLNMDVQCPSKLSVVTGGLPHEINESDVKEITSNQKEIAQHDINIPPVLSGPNSNYNFLLEELKLNSDPKDLEDIDEPNDKFSELLGMLNQ